MVGYQLIVKRLSGRARFRCTDCLLIFSITNAEVRKMLVRRMVMA